jgi:AsmA protein
MAKTWVRRALLGALVLALLLAIGIGIFVATFDANRYKGVATDWVKRELDRTLVIDGPVQLSVLPRLAIKVSGVKLSEHARPDEFAAVDEAALSLELMPLLSRQLVVQRVAAKGVRVTYARNAAGQSNVDDLLATSGEKEKAAGAGDPPQEGAALRFDIGAIELEDVRARIRDDKTPFRGDITLASLKSGRLASGVESPVSLRATLALSEPVARGQLSGDTRMKFDQASGSVALRDMRLEYKGEAAGLKELAVTLRGMLSYDGRTQGVAAEGLRVDLDGALGDLRLANARVAVERFGFDPAAKALSLSQLQARLAGHKGKDPLSFDLDWPKLEVTGQSVQGSDFGGKFSLAGATALEGTFKSAAPAGNFDRLRLSQVNASLKGRSGPRALDGSIRSDLLLELARGAAAMERLDVRVQVQEPSVQPLALTATGNARVSAEDAAWKLEGTLAPLAAQPSAKANRFSTDGTAKLAGDVPDLQVRASFDSLDLNQLLPPEPAQGASAPARAPSASAPAPSSPAADVPVDLQPLRSVNGRFALQAGSLVWKEIRVTDARLDAALDGGLLKVPRVQGKGWGGTIDASGQADARSNRVGLKLAGSGVDVNALLRTTAGFDRLEGTGRVNADLESLGKSVNEMKSRLKGTAALQLRDGAIRGVNLAKTFRQAKAALTMRQDAVQRASATEKTDFSELNATFRIADGVARNDDLEMKSPFLRLGGAGIIDIGRSRIDYTARTTVAATSQGQEGADLALLRGLTIPVKLTGPLDAVDWQVQWSAVAAGALGNKVQDKLRDSLGERLGIKRDRPADDAGGKSASDKAPARKEDAVKDKLRGLLR